MTTDHYAEAERLLVSARDLASIREADPEMRDRAVMATVAESQVHATLALTDAVRALKAGATVTTTFELADVAAQATPEQVMAAISAALRGGELEAAVGLIGVLARKDPHAADLLVRTIQYRPTT